MKKMHKCLMETFEAPFLVPDIFIEKEVYLCTFFPSSDDYGWREHLEKSAEPWVQQKICGCPFRGHYIVSIFIQFVDLRKVVEIHHSRVAGGNIP